MTEAVNICSNIPLVDNVFTYPQKKPVEDKQKETKKSKRFWPCRGKELRKEMPGEDLQGEIAMLHGMWFFVVTP